MNQPAPRPVPAMRPVDRALAFPRLTVDPFAFFRGVVEAYGPIVKVPIGAERLVLVHEPAWVHELLTQRTADTTKDAITNRLRVALGDGLVTAEGERWRAHRRLMAPAFQGKELEGYVTVMAALSEAWCARLPRGADVGVHAPLMTLTLDIVVRCLFGDGIAMDAAPIGHAVEAFMDRFVTELRSWRRLLPEPVLELGRGTVRREIATLDRLLHDVVAAGRARGGGGPELLSRLLAARDDAGVGFTDQELRDELVTLIVAGHETTALALTFALHLLARAPEVQAAARAEVVEALGDRAVTKGDLDRLPLVRAIALESMRLYPPVWAIGRQAHGPIPLGPYQVDDGSQIVVLQWVLHRSARFWDDPLTFRPERWLDGLERRMPKGLYLPFGGGARVCIGNHFAMMELVVVLATVLRRVVVSDAHDLPPLQPSVTARPTGPVRMAVRDAIAEDAVPRGSGPILSASPLTVAP
ncbi:MAG: cytochrome P450 [Alphaproteobacteria bacterium]|nr:cytochrome P450 [Alphaproteobacteria bacterium]